MEKTWLQESQKYVKEMYRKYGIEESRFHEAIDPEQFEKDPAAYLKSTDYVVTPEDKEFVLTHLTNMVFSDGNPVEGKIGPNGKLAVQLMELIARRNPEIGQEYTAAVSAGTDLVQGKNISESSARLLADNVLERRFTESKDTAIEELMECSLLTEDDDLFPSFLLQEAYTEEEWTIKNSPLYKNIKSYLDKTYKPQYGRMDRLALSAAKKVLANNPNRDEKGRYISTQAQAEKAIKIADKYMQGIIAKRNAKKSVETVPGTVDAEKAPETIDLNSTAKDSSKKVAKKSSSKIDLETDVPTSEVEEEIPAEVPVEASEEKKPGFLKRTAGKVGNFFKKVGQKYVSTFKKHPVKTSLATLAAAALVVEVATGGLGAGLVSRFIAAPVVNGVKKIFAGRAAAKAAAAGTAGVGATGAVEAGAAGAVDASTAGASVIGAETLDAGIPGAVPPATTYQTVDLTGAADVAANTGANVASNVANTAARIIVNRDQNNLISNIAFQARKLAQQNPGAGANALNTINQMTGTKIFPVLSDAATGSIQTSLYNAVASGQIPADQLNSIYAALSGK